MDRKTERTIKGQLDTIKDLKARDYSWTFIASSIGVSAPTLRKFRKEYPDLLNDDVIEEVKQGDPNIILLETIRDDPKETTTNRMHAVKLLMQYITISETDKKKLDIASARLTMESAKTIKQLKD